MFKIKSAGLCCAYGAGQCRARLFSLLDRALTPVYNGLQQRSIVQLVERRSPKPDVVGSSPTAPGVTDKMKKAGFTGFVQYSSLFLLSRFGKMR